MINLLLNSGGLKKLSEYIIQQAPNYMEAPTFHHVIKEVEKIAQQEFNFIECPASLTGKTFAPLENTKNDFLFRAAYVKTDDHNISFYREDFTAFNVSVITPKSIDDLECNYFTEGKNYYATPLTNNPESLYLTTDDCDNIQIISLKNCAHIGDDWILKYDFSSLIEWRLSVLKEQTPAIKN